MEKVLLKIDKEYEKERAKEKSKDQNLLWDNLNSVLIYSLTPDKDSKDNKGFQMPKNFLSLPLNKQIDLINNKKEAKSSFFINGLYKSLNINDFAEILKTISIPSNYLLRVLNYILQLKEKKENLLLVYLKTNYAKITEDLIIEIIVNIQNEDIYKYLLSSIPIDVNYMFQIIKDDSTIQFSKSIINLINKSLSQLNSISFGWDEFIKDLNLLCYLKKIIRSDSFTLAMEQLTKFPKNSTIDNIEINEIDDINNLELIAKFKNINDVVVEKFIV